MCGMPEQCSFRGMHMVESARIKGVDLVGRSSASEKVYTASLQNGNIRATTS